MCCRRLRRTGTLWDQLQKQESREMCTSPAIGNTEPPSHQGSFWKHKQYIHQENFKYTFNLYQNGNKSLRNREMSKIREPDVSYGLPFETSRPSSPALLQILLLPFLEIKGHKWMHFFFLKDTNMFPIRYSLWPAVLGKILKKCVHYKWLITGTSKKNRIWWKIYVFL